MSRTSPEQNYSSKTDFITRGKINILSAKIIIWGNQLWTRLLLVRTRTTEQCHQLTWFQLEQKCQSLLHKHNQQICQHYQRICQSKTEKRMYQGTRIQTHHWHTHHRKNLIPVNQIKRNAIKRKSVVNTRNRKLQNHRWEILIRLMTVITYARDIKRRAIGKRTRSNYAHI